MKAIDSCGGLYNWDHIVLLEIEDQGDFSCILQATFSTDETRSICSGGSYAECEYIYRQIISNFSKYETSIFSVDAAQDRMPDFTGEVYDLLEKKGEALASIEINDVLNVGHNLVQIAIGLLGADGTVIQDGLKYKLKPETE